MANPLGRVLNFPRRPNPITGATFQTQNALADADLRAALLYELLEDLLRKERERPDPLRVRMTCVAAQELLNELTVLYRRASCDNLGGNRHD
ncbi:hypothetical protein Pstr01_08870 [Pseudomonas straminea]|uniref:Uncharacterized protein n=1 Tax=Pseudomonas straminea TaxID=47882 RepID=A0A1I1SWC3_PSEOC|nr:hypothetical protein [Pseudomonas straminea]GLX12648.1 hypothetical protein Pstr01_08870 [Pseudomonas straminea]SFD50641.1 hypothetical protein SAMN05216372_102125 [Pseudomonas straminea]